MTPRHPPSARTVSRLRMLVKASELLNSSLDLDRILDVLLQYTVASLDATTGTIYLYDGSKGELTARRMRGGKELEIRLRVGEGVAGYVAETGKTVRISDAYKDKRFFQGIDQKSGFRTRSMLCAPMKNRAGKLIGVFQILNRKRGAFTVDDGKFLKSISIPATIAIENARLHQAEIESNRMQRDLELAAQLQQQILPKNLPASPLFRLEALTQPCMTVGGDFYDVIRSQDGSLILTVADASGKGVGAALLVSTFQAALHTYVEFGIPIRDTVTRLNRIIYEDSTTGSFVTAVLLSLDPASRVLSFVNAGHNNPLLIRSSGMVEELSTGGIPLGMLGESTFEVGRVVLEEGDLLVCYSDGITEAMNAKGRLFGEERLKLASLKARRKELRDVVTSLCMEVDKFAGSRPKADDLTLLLMRIPDTTAADDS
ncbi:MAG: SpoIIE family protein phosphatase [Ignavibacteria bacterium]|nr:SpoIIE family protein phosphatase [Ignavibacteria bacterium]